MFIYMITNIINNKAYIGYNASDVDRRWHEHKRDSKKNRFNNKLLYRAMNKYGIENFIYERIEDNISDINFLKKREVFWINELNTTVNGYNMTRGGDGGCGNKSFLKNASPEDLLKYRKKISSSKVKFFEDAEKRKEWSERSVILNLSRYMINGRDAGRKKWWESLTDEEKFNYQSRRAIGNWDKLSVEKQTQLSALRRDSAKKYHINMTEDMKKNRSENQKNRISGTYRVTLPSGEIIITNRLKDLCKTKELNISYNSLKISEKENRPLKNGWKCERIDTENK